MRFLIVFFSLLPVIDWVIKYLTDFQRRTEHHPGDAKFLAAALEYLRK